MNTGEILWVMKSVRRRNKTTPVTPFNSVFLKSQAFRHEFVILFRMMLKPKPLLIRVVRKSIANNGRDHDGKCIFRITPKTLRIRQHREYFKQQNKRPWITVHHEQRHRVRPLTFLLDEVNSQALNVCLEMLECI